MEKWNLVEQGTFSDLHLVHFNTSIAIGIEFWELATWGALLNTVFFQDPMSGYIHTTNRKYIMKPLVK